MACSLQIVGQGYHIKNTMRILIQNSPDKLTALFQQPYHILFIGAQSRALILSFGIFSLAQRKWSALKPIGPECGASIRHNSENGALWLAQIIAEASNVKFLFLF